METEKPPTKWKLEYWMNGGKTPRKFTRRFKTEDQARKYARSLGANITRYQVHPVKSRKQQTENTQE